jgi:hypothetical protein
VGAQAGKFFSGFSGQAFLTEGASVEGMGAGLLGGLYGGGLDGVAGAAISGGVGGLAVGSIGRVGAAIGAGAAVSGIAYYLLNSSASVHCSLK